jgi:ParB-like chromosome segregation protein Spo0J
MDTLLVDIGCVHPNKWNYNTETPATFQKVVESIRRYGFSDPVVVRVLADGQYEIVNGEHRWRAATELGMKKIPVFSLGEVDDVRAKQLCVTLNELGGTSDEVRLAQLLRDIAGDGRTLGDLEKVMPFSGNEIKQMLDSVDFSFSKLSKEDTRDKAPEKPPKVEKPPKAGKREKVSTVRVTVTVAPSRLAAVHSDPAKALWSLLEWWDTREEPEATP